MNEKKVVIVIVEGPSDESALGGIMKEYFSSEEVQFKVVHGDITSDENTAVDNELKDFSDEEKEQLSDDFSDKYEGKYLEFIAYISNESIAVPGGYKETWRFIEKERHSLQRHSNMHLIFKEK